MARYVLGTSEFSSKALAKEEFRRILNTNPDDVPLRGVDAELVALLVHEGHHPETVEKVGPGIAEVVVRRSDYGTRGFWLLRVDGSIVDFSYLTALDGPPTAEANVRVALRWEINDQITAFRDEQTSTQTCELCTHAVTATTSHVDHAEPTFNHLAEAFAQVAGGWTALAVECVGATGRQLADRNLAQVWRIYHERTARLRITHARCNLSRGQGD